MSPADESPGFRSPEHAEAQRNRILRAAEHCFIEHGFHAASIANISEKAGMSAGLIYRYFENKNAIILAIIDQQLKERRADIAKMRADFDFVGRMEEMFACWQKCDGSVMNPALFLEMSAEASREPQIAQALAQADKLTRADFREWLKSRAEAQGLEVSDQEVRMRAIALQCFIEGLLVRAIREPDRDMSELHSAVKLFLSHLLSFKDS